MSDYRLGPSKRTKAYPVKTFNGCIAGYIHYKIYGGDLDGIEIYDPLFTKDFRFIPVEAMGECEIKLCEKKLAAHLEYLKMERLDIPDDVA